MSISEINGAAINETLIDGSGEIPPLSVTLLAEPGSVVVSGKDVEFRSFKLSVESGSVVVSGQDADLTIPIIESGPVIESFTSGSSNGSTATSVTAPVPSGLTTDDIWLVICGDDADGDTNNWDDISGWTKIVHAGDGTSDSHLQAYYKVAGSSESAQSFTHGGVSDELWCASIRISGVDTESVIHQSGFTAGQATAQYTISGITTTVVATLIVYAQCQDGADGEPFSINSGDSSDWTQKASIASGDSGNDAAGSWGVKNIPPRTNESTGAVTIDSGVSDGQAGLMISFTYGNPLTHYSEIAGSGSMLSDGQIAQLAYSTYEDVRDGNQLGINDVDYWDVGDALIVDQSDYLELEVP